MNSEELPELPRLGDLAGMLASLSTRCEEHLDRAIDIGMNNICADDHLVIAALRRALDNIQGMVAMMDQKNMFCGMPIVRFQIDTAMTLFGRRLVGNVDAYVGHMMGSPLLQMKEKERREYLNGKNRRKYLKEFERGKFKDRYNKAMTDSYLHKKLTEEYEYASYLYWEASGFVHFSTLHLFRVLDLDLYKRTGEVTFRSHDEIVAGWPDEEIRGALVQFVYASKIILDECEIWEKKRRPEREIVGSFRSDWGQRPCRRGTDQPRLPNG